MGKYLYTLLLSLFLLVTTMVTAQAPAISSFAPGSGPVGTLVTITGNNLSNPTSVNIGGTPAIVVSNTGTSLLAMVMPGAVTGTVSITTAGGSATASGNFTITPTPYPNTQQGGKLVGTGATPTASQGYSVAVSADGNTAIVGGNGDNGYTGAAWVYTRSGGVWIQQGSKLAGTGAVGSASQGVSVSLSADGNTAIVGGPNDNSNVGAAWVYTRSGGNWTQQGNKLVGTGAIGTAQQGVSVSLSADGNTAIVGGWSDNGNVGAAWVYTRSGGNWTQQGNKLVGTGAIGSAYQGWSVSISADGNTAIVGGYNDNTTTGASWVYTRSGTSWTQQGNKLVGTGAIGSARQGYSVSLSAGGNTAIVGGYGDNSQVGAAWVYTRSGSIWTQQGNKLVGTGSVGIAQQGSSVSLSADGNTAIVGGFGDNGGAGAAWVYTRSGSTWTQQANNLVGTGAVGFGWQGWSVSLSADGNTAIVGGLVDNSNAGAAWVYIAPPPPAITSFASGSGPVGTLVTITGSNLSNPTSVIIGGTPAIVVSNTGTSLVAMVMPGAVTGTVSVTTTGGSATASGNFTVTPTPYPNTQQGGKLVGTGAVGGAQQGMPVAISADGNTAIVGGPTDNATTGASWVYTRSGSTWTQQGNKLVGTGAVGTTVYQGVSVAISADGNTVIIGGQGDNNYAGAAWVYTRSGGVWTQQGSKLVGTGATAVAQQGLSVAISADGNTAIVGGYGDNAYAGAAWVYTRSGGAWTQQGNKLVGTGTAGGAQQGTSVAVSADGNTAIVGGPNDNNSAGAVWVYTRSGGVWTQQGNKLVGTGAVGTQVYQGASVAVSADGNTAIVGGNGDNTWAGAAWVYTRSGGVWTQQGNKLVGTGATGAAQQGHSVAISADGNTTIVGGHADNLYAGAAWVYTRSGGVWTQRGNKLVGTGATGAAQQGYSIAISADGNTGMVGGYADNANAGAAWVYIVPPPPAIASFASSSGPVGTLVAIAGSNLSSPTSVNIGGTPAIVVSNTGTSLVAMVMPGAVTGTVSVTTAGGSATATGNFTVTPTPYPNTQQGGKLVGTGATGVAQQGYSAALSADGNTAIVGGYTDNTGAGAAWVYTRSGTNWVQQGNKLVGTGAIGNALQGYSVAISADGNTVIVGGRSDNNGAGAAWVYVRSGSNWTQQGNKLVGSGAVGAAYQGWSVGISADGNTVIVGARNDNNFIGAAWVYTRSGGSWVQQGNKLVGTGATTGSPQQGYSVSLSADGNTAIVGGVGDNSNTGAAWVYVYSGNNWVQQGSKLVGTGVINGASQGASVALSADGNTAIVGGYSDNNSTGAAWVYTRSGGSWAQQGNKLVGTGAIGAAFQGTSVSISADGNTAMVGGIGDNSHTGAAWVYTRSGGIWTQQGNKLVGTGIAGAAWQSYSVGLSADGNTAIVGGPNDNNNAGAAWAYVYQPYLSSLTTTAGSISPVFSSTTLSYTAWVANSVSTVTVTPALVNTNDVITVNGTAVSSGSASPSITLATGANTITVVLTSQGGATTTYTLTINKAPALTATINTTTAISCNGGNNGSITAVAGGGRTPYTYAWSPGASTNAALSGLSAGTAYTVTITDANGTTATASVTLTQPTAIAFTNSTLPAGTYGMAYSQNAAASGGTGSISYSIFAGSLPAGISLNTSTGNVSGTPTATGTSNFTIMATDANGCTQTQNYIMTINKAALTITANNQTKTYDGIAYSGGNGVSYSGFALSDNAASLTGTLTYGGTSQGAVGTGTYSIVPSGLSSNNYNISYQPGTLLVTANNTNTLTFNTQTAGATVTAVYGSADINGSAVASSGLAASYTSSNTGVATVNSSGQIHITGTGTTTITASQAGNSNYGPAPNISFTVQVNPAPLTITAVNASKTFDGTAYSGGNGVSYSGFVNNETSAVLTGTVVYGGTAQGAANTGNYTITASGLSSSNYNINYINGSLSIVASGNNVITYNSQTAGSTLNITYGQGTINASAVATSGLAINYASDNTAAVTVNSAGQVTIVGAGTANITVTQGGGANYTAATPVSFKIVVAKQPLTITANNYSKTYDGTAYSGGNNVVYTGFVNGESAANFSGALVYTGSAQGATGTGSYLITPSGYSSNNYAITYQSGSLTITKATLGVIATAQTKVYGTTDPALTYTATGFAGTDNASMLTGSLNRGAGENVGTYAINQNSLSAGNNYNIVYTSNNLTVIKATLNIVADAKTKAYGDTDPLLTCQINGLVGGDAVSGALSRNAGENTGGYVINQNNLSAGNNYMINYTSNNLTITQVPLTVTAADQQVCMNGSLQSVVLSYSGFKNNETVANLTRVPVVNSSMPAAPGTYALTPAGGQAANYHFNYISGTLTVWSLPAGTISQSATAVGSTAGATLMAPAGASYLWSTGETTNSILTKSTGSYTVTVTNQQGCSVQFSTATQLSVPGGYISVPNTFTPNGDGINDYWTIPELRNYPGTLVVVLNKDGQKVFESSNFTRWDGKYNGKDLPAGVYFYLLDTHKGYPYKQTGWINLVR